MARCAGDEGRCTGLVSIYIEVRDAASACRAVAPGPRSLPRSQLPVCLAAELGSHCKAKFPHQALHTLLRERDGWNVGGLRVLHVPAGLRRSRQSITGRFHRGARRGYPVDVLRHPCVLSCEVDLIAEVIPGLTEGNSPG